MVTPPIAPDLAGRGRLVERIRAAAGAGAHLVQIRQPALEGGALTWLVRDAVSAVRGTGARILVNDRLDVALAAGAHGVHLRGDSVHASRVRSIAPSGFLIGRSVHARDEAAHAARDGGLDYLLFGNVFETASKPGASAAGTAALAAVCAAVSLPVLAIGGMTPDRLVAVARSGAAGFAAIGLFSEELPGAIEAMMREAVQLFDTPAGVP